MTKKDKPPFAEGALLLFDKLCDVRREGDIFIVTAKSCEYTISGAMTAEYVRELISRLTPLLGAYDAERGKPAANVVRGVWPRH